MVQWVVEVCVSEPEIEWFSGSWRCVCASEAESGPVGCGGTCVGV